MTISQRPFTLHVALAIVFAVGFVVWTWLVFRTDRIVPFDEATAARMADVSDGQPLIRNAMVLITHTGGTRGNAIIAALGAIWMWRHHRRRFALAWMLVACIGGAAVLGLKEGFDRERPPIEMRDEAILQTNESYPSGHAAGSVIGYGMLGFVLVHRFKCPGVRIAIGLGLAAWITLIGLSRVYLRAHWASDVAAGWLFALSYVNACLALYFRRPHVVADEPSETSPTLPMA